MELESSDRSKAGNSSVSLESEAAASIMAMSGSQARFEAFAPARQGRFERSKQSNQKPRLSLQKDLEMRFGPPRCQFHVMI
jgi:hypothetical protein